MKGFLNKFLLIFMILALKGCSPFGPGSLKNYVSIKVNQRFINIQLPKGFCTDEHARVASDIVNTSVITNCVSLRQDNSTIFGRRPVDTVITLTNTEMTLPTSFSEKQFLNSLLKNDESKNLVPNSRSIRLKIMGKSLKDGSLIIDLQQTSAISSVRKIRKYVFFVGNKISILTISNFDRKSKLEYSKFEAFIKLLKKASS